MNEEITVTALDEEDTAPLSLTVTEATAGTRLDVAAAEAFGITRSSSARLIDDHAILVGGRAVPRKYRLALGDVVSYLPPAPIPSDAQPEDIPLDVVYEDDDLLVINKPKGMVVHPAPGNERGTLVNALLYHCKGSLSGIGGTVRPGIVHRIDKDTSGLLVVAKNDEAHQGLAAQLEGHRIRREYRALVSGHMKESVGTVNRPIGRHPVDRKRMAVLTEGRTREAITHYRVLASYEGIDYLSLELETGRTHQIRVHMSSMGHPLLGDTLYGGGKTPFEKRHAAHLSGQCLHATALSFTHPRTGKAMHFEVALPDDFSRLLAILEQKA